MSRCCARETRSLLCANWLRTLRRIATDGLPGSERKSRATSVGPIGWKMPSRQTAPKSLPWMSCVVSSSGDTICPGDLLLNRSVLLASSVDFLLRRRPTLCPRAGFKSTAVLEAKSRARSTAYASELSLRVCRWSSVQRPKRISGLYVRCVGLATHQNVRGERSYRRRSLRVQP